MGRTRTQIKKSGGKEERKEKEENIDVPTPEKPLTRSNPQRRLARGVRIRTRRRIAQTMFAVTSSAAT